LQNGGSDPSVFCFLHRRVVARPVAAEILPTKLRLSLQDNFSVFSVYIPQILPTMPRACFHLARAFTLFELLLVTAIMVIVAGFITPAFTGIKGASDVSKAAYDIVGMLEQARAYAMRNNTYVFVGLSEVDDSVDAWVAPQVTTTANPYGRVALAVVASKDGTRHFQYATAGQGADWQANYLDSTKPEYNGSHLTALNKLQRFENLHFLVEFGSWTPAAHPASSMARSLPSASGTWSYTLGSPKCISVTPFTWPLGSALNDGYQYRFDKVVVFDPQGVARIQNNSNSDDITQRLEIDLEPSHGTIVTTPAAGPRTNQDVGNLVVIQFDCMTGASRVFRP
jgi:type II secretory pathway pseudopilin PulG